VLAYRIGKNSCQIAKLTEYILFCTYSGNVAGIDNKDSHAVGALTGWLFHSSLTSPERESVDWAVYNLIAPANWTAPLESPV
jgi:hypothetical protein